MSIQVECSGCQKKYQVADTAAGKSIRCKVCGTTTRVPAPEEPDDDAFLAELSEEDAADDGSPDELPAAGPAGRRIARETRQPARSRSSSLGKWLLIIAGSGAALLLVCCGGGYFFVSSMLKTPPPSAQANEPFPVETLRAPAFPELGPPQTIGQTGVQLYNLDLSAANPGNTRPAARMQLRVYVPPGEHADASLGCVLLAPAGTNLLTTQWSLRESSGSRRH
jgi:hypothetical protein